MLNRLSRMLLIVILLANFVGTEGVAAGPRASFSRYEWAFASWVPKSVRPYVSYQVSVRRTIGPLPTEESTKVVVRKVPCERSYGDLWCTGGRRVRKQLNHDEFSMTPTVTGAELSFKYRGRVNKVTWTYDEIRQPGVFYGANETGAGVATWQTGWPARAEGRLLGQRLRRSEGRGILEAWTEASVDTDIPKSIHP